MSSKGSGLVLASHGSSPPQSGLPAGGAVSLLGSTLNAARRGFSSAHEEGKGQLEEDAQPRENSFSTNIQQGLLILTPIVQQIEAVIQDYQARQAFCGCVPTLYSYDAARKANLLSLTLVAALRSDSYNETLKSAPVEDPVEDEEHYAERMKSFKYSFLNQQHQVGGRSISLAEALNENRLPVRREQTETARSILNM